jgi:hypothetical protein
MYCLDCAYNLIGLDAHRCPECGLVYDPYDPESFDVTPGHHARDRASRWLEWMLIASGAVPLVANVFGMLSLLIARVTLGRWPMRGGADDPSSVPGIGLIGVIGIVLVLLMFPSMVGACMFAGALLMRQAFERAARGGAIALVLWVCGAALVIRDPAEVWMWLFD